MSLVVIVTELTASVTYAVPVMLGVMVAKTVADALEPKGIYDLVIQCVISFFRAVAVTYQPDVDAVSTSCPSSRPRRTTCGVTPI